MDINDVRSRAQFYQKNYLETFYLISTYSGKSFILIGERENFPHLMGIKKSVYNSNGYRSPKTLYRDILMGNPISNKIIPNNISLTSKMYKKILNFKNSTDIFWNNRGPLAVSFNPVKSGTKLANVDILITDIEQGYMLGWTKNTSIAVNAEIKLVKYCISTWIDESGGSVTGKEKYLPLQTVDLIRSVFAFDKNSELLKQKEYRYDYTAKKDILEIVERNRADLMLDSRNQRYYIDVAKQENIHCIINGAQY